MKYKLKMERDQVEAKVAEMVAYAHSLCDYIEFSPEDAGRSDPEFLYRVLEIAIKAGATTLNIPDTVGYTMPDEFGGLIAGILKHTPGIEKCTVSVHCHNDLGLATANSLAAVRYGARQVECTINGLGERAGNAALEEVVMAVRTRQDLFDCDVRLDTTQIVPCSRLVSSITGFPVQPNKAVVGANAFAHEAGIHQDGVLKHRETYEIMRAQDVGWNANRMVLGKHSGRNALRSRLQELGVVLTSEEELNTTFSRFKDLADKKHEVFDEDLQALVTEASLEAAKERVKLVSLRVCSETGETPAADLVLLIDGVEQPGTATGAGPVDATFRAIESIVASDAVLKLYSVNAITSGTDAQGEVTVRLEKGGRIVNGQGADTDIVIASAKAYLNAVNKILQPLERSHPQIGNV
jgi:2-isopropylmalate synthase